MTDAGQQEGGGRTIAGFDAGVLRIAAVVVVGAFMSIVDTTIVNIALEDISSELHTAVSDVQWIVTGYLLALATVIPLSGWITERFDARRVWMGSVVLFVVGSVLCGLAWSTGALIAFRVLQGLGGGLIMPVGIVLLTQAAGPDRVGRVMSVIGVPMLIAPVVGPVLGGLIVQNISWRWIFYVNVPVAAVALTMAWRLLPHGSTGDAGRLDWRGLLLASPGVALVIFGLSEGSSTGGFSAWRAWGPIVLGAAMLAAFVLHARRAENPIIKIDLFRGSVFASAATTILFVGAALFGGLFLLPIYLQVARGESPLDAGLLLAPQGVGAAIMVPFAGRLTDRIGGGPVAFVGLILVALATLPFATVSPDTSTWWLEASLVVRGLGLGATMMPSLAAGYAPLRREEVPRATSALNVIQRVGGSLGTAVLAVVLGGQLSGLGSGAGQGLGAARQASPAARERLAEPLTAAFAHTFWWALALAVVAMVPAAVLTWAGSLRPALSSRSWGPGRHQAQRGGGPAP